VSPKIPDTRYARSGDVHIAYRRFGSGGLNLVVIPALVSNVDLEYKLAGVREAEEAFDGFTRGGIFDKRGTGVSDRVGGIPSLETRMDDLRMTRASPRQLPRAVRFADRR
jgi:hypothetical protein